MSATIETTTSGLPVEFADWEPFSAWILETQPERWARRIAVPMAEMQAFYDVCFPRLPAAMEYCNRFALDDLPEPVRRLMWLIFSLMEVSLPVEAWRQGKVPDSGACTITCVKEPII